MRGPRRLVISAVLQQLGEADDAVQRRPGLVLEERQEALAQIGGAPGFVAGGADLRLHPACARDVAELVAEQAPVHRLRHEGGGAELVGPVDGEDVVAGRDHDHRQMSEARAGADLAEKAEAVQPRHLQIGQNEVEAAGIALEDGPGRFAVLGGGDLAARLAELRHRELPHDRVVVDGKQPQRLVEDVSITLPGMREQHVGSRLRRGAYRSTERLSDR